jgi:hypothetical protein
MDEETRRELRRNKLYYSCKDPWDPDHQCMGKWKVHYIEVLPNEEDDSDDKVVHA